MYNIIKNVIGRKNYDLSGILRKIDTFWVQGGLTDEQRAELTALAQNNAHAGNSVDVLRKLEELDKRIKAVEELFSNVDEENPTETPTEPTYAEYEVGKWYYEGDIVAFEGGTYECIAPEGVVCVWSPTEYPVYWQDVNTIATIEETQEEPSAE